MSQPVHDMLLAEKPWRNIYGPFCGKCGGTGMIETWAGRRGLGGRAGPCPLCRVEATKRFLTELARETFNIGGTNNV